MNALTDAALYTTANMASRNSIRRTNIRTESYLHKNLRVSLQTLSAEESLIKIENKIEKSTKHNKLGGVYFLSYNAKLRFNTFLCILVYLFMYRYVCRCVHVCMYVCMYVLLIVVAINNTYIDKYIHVTSCWCAVIVAYRVRRWTCRPFCP